MIYNPPLIRSPYIPTRWYVEPITVGVVAGTAPGANLICLSAFFLQVPITISDLACRITTALAANNVQLAIYSSNANGLPTGPPVAVTGNISTAAAGAVSADIVGPNVLLLPGLYWAAINHSGASSAVQCVGPNSSFMGVIAGSTTLANISSAATITSLIYTIAQAFGSWPNLTGGGYAESVANTGVLLFMKAA